MKTYLTKLKASRKMIQMEMFLQLKTYLTITVKEDEAIRLELVVSTLRKSRITMLGGYNIIVAQDGALRTIWRPS